MKKFWKHLKEHWMDMILEFFGLSAVLVMFYVLYVVAVVAFPAGYWK